MKNLQKPSLKLFGERIKETRKKAGYKSIPDASAAVNMPKTSWAKYEAGYRFPRYESLIEIAVFFDVCPLWLMGSTNEPSGKASQLNNKNEAVELSGKDLDGFIGKLAIANDKALELSFRLIDNNEQ